MKQIKKISAIILVISLLAASVIMPASAITNPTAASISREVAGEGIVLLKNDDQVLPLKTGETVSVFGRVQVDSFYCGFGSGGGVQKPYLISILDGIKNNPAITINEELANVYERWCAENAPNLGSWGSWPFHYEEMPLTEQQVADARAKSEVALVVLGRSSGEDRDAKEEAGSYYLTADEKSMLSKINTRFDKIAVILNVGSVMDMAWLADYSSIKSVMYAWQGGMEAGNAVADVLSGDRTPSGKLSDTIAKTYADYPSVGEDSFGNGSVIDYKEDIFVGYRYFETFAKDRVLYPFGFGLSYTDFAINADVSIENDNITVRATVTNTGETYSGKEVVQVYFAAPQGTLGKPARQLINYVKTNEIAPGGSQTVTLSFSADKMASYDDCGKTGNQSAWVLEPGNYDIYVGNSVRSAAKAGTYTLANLRITEQLEEANAVSGTDAAFNRMTAAGNADGTVSLIYEQVPSATQEADLATRVLKNLPDAVSMTGDQGIKLIDVYNGTHTMDEFVAQLTPQELSDISRGDYTKGSSLGPSGNASVFGGVTESLRNKGISSVATCDGPSGIGGGCTASLVPIGTLQACTWNDSLIERLYAAVATEMDINGFDALLGPGMNIHRNPLCGRNFEYFSEDPLLTGLMGAGVVKGLQKNGSAAVPKHFALNNQEYCRYYYDSRVSERAQREIYLRGFEIVVKTAKPYYIMGSYNQINGEYSHYNYDLCTTILRKDWGYEGLLITDWWLREASSSELGNVKNNAYRVRAQMDVNMPGEGPGDNSTSERTLLNAYDAWVAAGSPTDTLVGLTLGEMQRSARNVLNCVMDSSVFRKTYNLSNRYTPGNEWFTSQGTEWVESPVLDSLTIEGMPEFNAFNPNTKIYKVFRRDLTTVPAVCAAADGANVNIVQATPQSPSANITVVKNGGKCTYRVIFTNEAGLNPVVSGAKPAKITGIKVNNRYIAEFYPTIYRYTVTGTAATAEITADAADGVDYSVTLNADNTVTLRAETDDQANEYVLSFRKPSAIVTMESDNFENGILDDKWSVLNRTDSLVESDGALNITTDTAGSWDKLNNSMKNVVYQNADGDWTATIEMCIRNPAALSKSDNNLFGITVFDDPDNYVNLNVITATWSGNDFMFWMYREQDSENSNINGADASQTYIRNNLPRDEKWTEKDSVTVWFRVSKSGDTYTFSLQTENMLSNGKDFRIIGVTDFAFSQPKIGFYATRQTASTTASTVSFKSFQVDKEHQPISDDFEDGVLGNNWAVMGQTSALCESNGSVNITTESVGSWDKLSNNMSNVVYQSAIGDWTATAEMVITDSATLKGKDGCLFGITAFDDYDHYVSLNYMTCSWNGNGHLMWMYREEDGTNSNVLGDSKQQWTMFNLINTSEQWQNMSSVTVWLRIKKSGDEYTMSMLTQKMKDAGKDFVSLGTTTFAFSSPKFGVYATRTGSNAPVSTVKYNAVTFDDCTLPVEPEPVEKEPVRISSTDSTKIMACEDAVYLSTNLKTEACTDETATGTNISKGMSGEYGLYPITVEKAGWYDISTRYASANATVGIQLNHNIELDGERIAAYSPGVTGGWQVWRTTAANRVYFPAGRHTLRFNFSEEMSLNYIMTTPTAAHTVTVSDSKNGSTGALSASAEPGDTVTLILNPNTGYRIAGVTVANTDNLTQTVGMNGDNTFVMPDFNVTVTAEYSRIGDVNGDGVTNIKDLVNLKKRLAASTAFDATLDLNNDGHSDASDLIWIRRLLLQ